MNKKIVGLTILVSMLFLANGFGQTASPLVSPKAVSPSVSPKTVSPSASPKAVSPLPSAKAVSSPAGSPATGPIVRVRIVVRCDEAAIRSLVDSSLRTELAKAKNVQVLSGPGSSSLIIGVKLVPVTGVQSKSPLYAMQLSLFDTPALFNALETAGLTRQVIYTLLVANELQPIREENVLTVVSKAEIPAKITSLIPLIEQRGVERALLAMTMNQQRKPGAQTDTDSVREDVP